MHFFGKYVKSRDYHQVDHEIQAREIMITNCRSVAIPDHGSEVERQEYALSSTEAVHIFHH